LDDAIAFQNKEMLDYKQQALNMLEKKKQQKTEQGIQ
jgi:hypothetical protein